MINKEPRIYLTKVLLSSIVFLSALSFAPLIVSRFSGLPQIPLSNSDSFNRKAEWLKKNIQGNCDTLVVGSSMSLNNFNPDIFQKYLSGSGKYNSIKNASSWGINLTEASNIVKSLKHVCKPKLVITFTNFHDFRRSDKKINFEAFSSYLDGSYKLNLSLSNFLENTDLKNTLKSIITLRDQTDRQPKIEYTSLNFDETGSVNFECNNFNVNQERWNAFKMKPLNFLLKK